MDDRYELQIKNGDEWHHVTGACSIAALIPDAQNFCAGYRVVDTQKNRWQTLNVTISGGILEGGWRRM